MAYDFGRQSVLMTATNGAPTVVTTSTGATVRFRWTAPTDVVVHAVGLFHGSAALGGLTRLSFRTTTGALAVSGKEFSRVATTATTAQMGKMVVRKGLNTSVSVGSHVVANVILAAASKVIGAVLYVSQKPYDYANKTQITLVTT